MFDVVYSKHKYYNFIIIFLITIKKFELFKFC
jgi:hypothetical protein